MNLPELNPQPLLDFLTRLLNTPSPTGLTDEAIEVCFQTLTGLEGVELQRTRKGGLMVIWHGEVDSPARALSAHVDTLGAMVKEIKPNGRLKMTMIGGSPWTAVENEGCTIFTNDGRHYRGSILVTAASGHVYGSKTNDTKREADTVEVRIDARTAAVDETEALGIQVGDFIAFDPRVEVVEGFVRSRHLDDKACVACLVAAIQTLHAAGQRPSRTAYFLISNFEEVGHGASTGFPIEVEELLVVDMAAVGDGQTSDEHHVSICVKDSSGPYHHGFSNHLRRLAEEQGIDYRVDIYPNYGSDGSALLRAGGDLRVALIGPGVDASHSYERTHTDALVDTTRWVMAYLLGK